MGLTICTFAGALRSFRRWFGRLASPSAAGGVSRPAGTRLHTAAGRAHVAWPPAAHRASPPRRPLRVLRVVDAGHASSTAGRMVISGRMADVCAELDRLVALEAAAA